MTTRPAVISTLAALKRYLQVGVKFWCIHNHKGDTLPVTRTVAGVQTNGIWCYGPDYQGQRLWLYWPSVKQITFKSHGFRIDNGDRYVEYIYDEPIF